MQMMSLPGQVLASQELQQLPEVQNDRTAKKRAAATSGVTSLSAKPVPPVVRIRSATPESAQDTWIFKCSNTVQAQMWMKGFTQLLLLLPNRYLSIKEPYVKNRMVMVIVIIIRAKENLTRWRRMAVWSSGQHSVAITFEVSFVFIKILIIIANQHIDHCGKDTRLKWKLSYLTTQYHLISYQTMKQCCKYVFCFQTSPPNPTAREANKGPDLHQDIISYHSMSF